jgi:hypothetical protein
VQVWVPLLPTFAIKDLHEKIAARKALIVPGGTMHTKLLVVEKLLKASTTKYYLGDEMSVADVLVFSQYGVLASGCAPCKDAVLDVQGVGCPLVGYCFLIACRQTPRRSVYRFLDGLDISSMKGCSKMVDIRNKVAAEPKVAAQYADRDHLQANVLCLNGGFFTVSYNHTEPSVWLRVAYRIVFTG